ncbi:hypothetical protein HT136_01355 [Novosphingobium profundi]|uniref:hypothetical protein n=1 Tax=Novosphingobium profundi TaxID=1774954 RepID=UPI001BDB4EF9|nr:hypothetical protein [Novosphingobium profundi]MBT0667013.1 hypothetical protein [Novosphingobium profundi]
MRLTVEFFAGTTIEEASEQAQALADKLDLTVAFKFNGVMCHAAPGGSAELLAADQQAEQRRYKQGAHDWRSAWSRSRAA